MLEVYAGRLPTVEINNTFYRMPKKEVLEKWAATVPESFRFVLKASRRITHHARLEGAGDSVRYLLEVSDVLGSRRGPFLLQLPPFLRKDTARLDAFLDEWPDAVPAAFEFRHPSWFDQEVFDVLAGHRAALCIADTSDEDKNPPLVATADFGYLRLRREDYDRRALAEWGKRVREQGWKEAYVFFKHEDEGAGPRMAEQFRDDFEG